MKPAADHRLAVIRAACRFAAGDDAPLDAIAARLAYLDAIEADAAELQFDAQRRILRASDAGQGPGPGRPAA